jgi:hypothetical protein
LVSELLEYREDVKENDHATDALRYSLPLATGKKLFLFVVRRRLNLRTNAYQFDAFCYLRVQSDVNPGAVKKSPGIILVPFQAKLKRLGK